MSYLSDLVRAATGRSVGENIGRAIGTAVGGTTGGRIGEKIGGATTRAIDTDRSNTGQAVAVDAAPEPPRENAMSGETGSRVGSFPVTNPIPPETGFTRGGIVPATYVPPTPQTQMKRNVALPAIIGGGTSVVRGVGGMLGLAGGAIMVAPTIIDQFTGEEKKLRVTRKLKSQVRKAVEMFGVEFVADQMGTSVDVVFYILTKRMRNDGPYVTKAAVRKTRQTVRKMKTLCDMYDDLRPAARRRAPARKTATTRITQVK
tara:strand:- start:422 stop:1198 length:777 start_codon:yes stop_codon:yes gene_type:complete